MSIGDELRQSAQRVKREVRQAARGRGTTNVSVARRTNVVMSSNVGQQDAVHAVSSRQSAPIVQRSSEDPSQPD